MNTSLSTQATDAVLTTRQAYSSAADRFDDAPLGFWERCGQTTVRHLSLSRGATVLDAGCGTGASALQAARVVGPRGHVVGVDLADELLQLARRKAEREGLCNVEFQRGDMRHLGFHDASFDSVVCVFAIFFVPDMAAQLAKLWRLVRPGGTLAITVWGSGLFEPAASEFWRAVRRQRPDLERQFCPWDELVDPDSLSQLFAAAGAAAPQIVIEQDSQPLAKSDDWWTIACGTGYRWTIDRLSPDQARRVREENLGALRESRVRSIATNYIRAVACKA